MCITEVWTYRECGCHYNHSLLCRSYRRNRSPCFAPNIQYSLEEWQQQRVFDNTSTASPQVTRPGRPTEPQNCPHHAFVQRSFLNQICEDCLIRELEIQPLSLTDEQPSSVNPDGGEGLIWDSEVTIEVEEMQFEMLSSPQGKRVDDGRDADHEEDDDKRLLESHVEVNVDFDSYSASGEEATSPLFPSPATRSPSSSSIEDLPLSPSYRTKRYGFALPPGVTYDLEDADDDSDDYPEIYDWTSSPLFRGRSLTRKQLTSFELYGVSPNGSDGSSKDKGLASLRTLRSISTNLRTGSMVKNDSKVVGRDAAIAESPRSLFRGFRSRKSSPLVAQSVEVNRVVGSHCTGPYDNLEPKDTKKSGLKSWAKFMIPDRKRNKHAALREIKTKARSRAPSPTGSWARNQGYHHDELPILGSKPESKLNTGSVESLIDDKSVEKREALRAMNPGTPDSPRLLAEVPAAIPHRQLLEKQELKEESDEISVNDITMPQHRPTVVTGNNFELSGHAQEVQEVARCEVNNAEDQATEEASVVQREALTSNPPATMPGSEAEEAEEEEAIIVEPGSAEQDAHSTAASTQDQGRSPLSPQSRFIQSIIDSSDARPHPPRKSSLRRLISIKMNASRIPKYSLPLPRIEAERPELDEGERNLLSGTNGNA
ncbi:uncharacterized protein A1O9_00163 [Exophiala aquamarina CBS 119918]|uniref:Uncharacterized protein n=1 Tax=Exophiala aquamarina CBS 119918 TaxID=1182545 RepID=A0A072PQP1_9EURO|nr:uncharacterized protein A1O9_00163 [Exophiala aquamarina CBS 119918]KEF62191.1 hypothetical protein A1O9_00163 [Exophiala aquamarina CBS 119918]